MKAVRLPDPFSPGAAAANAATPTCCCCCCCCAVTGVTSLVLIATAENKYRESISGPIAAGCFVAVLEFFAFLPLFALLGNVFGDGAWVGYLGVVLLVALVAFIIRGLIHGNRDTTS